MADMVERRKVWSRIIGVERRAAPLPVLEGRPLPDPTRLEDEDFLEARRDLEKPGPDTQGGPELGGH